MGLLNEFKVSFFCIFETASRRSKALKTVAVLAVASGLRKKANETSLYFKTPQRGFPLKLLDANLPASSHGLC